MKERKWMNERKNKRGKEDERKKQLKRERRNERGKRKKRANFAVYFSSWPNISPNIQFLFMDSFGQGQRNISRFLSKPKYEFCH